MACTESNSATEVSGSSTIPRWRLISAVMPVYIISPPVGEKVSAVPSFMQMAAIGMVQQIIRHTEGHISVHEKRIEED